MDNESKQYLMNIGNKLKNSEPLDRGETLVFMFAVLSTIKFAFDKVFKEFGIHEDKK